MPSISFCCILSWLFFNFSSRNFFTGAGGSRIHARILIGRNSAHKSIWLQLISLTWLYNNVLAPLWYTIFFCSFRSEKMIYHQFKYVLKFCNCSIETIFCDDQTLKISWNHRGMKPCRILFFSCSPIPTLRIRISRFFLTNYRLKIIFFVKHMLLVERFLKIHDSWVRNWCWIHRAKYLCMWMKKAADEIFYLTFYGHFLHKYGTKVRCALIF